MQIPRGEWLEPAAAMAVVGALVAAGISFAVPQRYVSSATLRMKTPEGAPARIDPLDELMVAALDRSSLGQIIDSLDLYHEQRERVPIENVVDQMRRDLQVQPLAGPPGAQAFRISVTYSDPDKTPAVVDALVRQMKKENESLGMHRERMSKEIWNAPLPPADEGAALEVTDSPSPAEQGTGPNRLMFAAWGFVIGPSLGLAGALVRGGPRRALRIAAWAAGGSAMTLVFSYWIPDSYTSVATLRITPPLSPQRWFAVVPAISPRDRFEQLSQKVLRSENLIGIIQKPAENLYIRERERTEKLPSREADATLLALAERMRRGIDMSFTAPSKLAIAFTYIDRYKAQSVVRELVNGFIEENVQAMRPSDSGANPQLVRMSQFRVGENIEVVDPATLPEIPVSPNRAAIALGGLAAGLLVGAYLERSRRTPDPPVVRESAHS